MEMGKKMTLTPVQQDRSALSEDVKNGEADPIEIILKKSPKESRPSL